MKHKTFISVCLVFVALLFSQRAYSQITDIDQLQGGADYVIFDHSQCKYGMMLAKDNQYGCENSINRGLYEDITYSTWHIEKSTDSDCFYIYNSRGGYIKNINELTSERSLAAQFYKYSYDGDTYFSGRNVSDECFCAFDIYRIEDCILNIGIFKYFLYHDSKDASILKDDSQVYYGDVIIPSKIEYKGNAYSVTHIEDETFENASEITSIKSDTFLTAIGNKCFAGCKKLKSVNFPALKEIGYDAFKDCINLYQIELASVTKIGSSAFEGCVNLRKIELPVIESLGFRTFYDCNLKFVSLPSTLHSYNGGCFNKAHQITFQGKEPPRAYEKYSSFSSGLWPLFSECTMIKVPADAVETYKKADVWNKYVGQILSLSDNSDYDVTTCAQSNSSGLYNAIGGNNLDKVISLKVRGTINGYDIMLMRNKMPHLNDIDISETTVLANNYEYYTGYHTEDNVIGGYSFYNWSKLASLKLPKSVTEIGVYAVGECHNLSDVILPNSLITIKSRAFYQDENLNNIEFPTGLKTIGSDAFSDCKNLSVAELPANLETIASGVFSGCKKLTRIELPPNLKTISTTCFADCSSLDSISLPGVETIGKDAFRGCRKLTEIRIPSTLKSIGDNAFSCENLKKVYTYTIEPVNIGQNTFSNYAAATLYVPRQAYNNYYYNTQWSQFANLVEFDEPYKYFYLNKEFILNDRFTGEPDIDINPGGGIIVPDKPEQGDQDADTIHIKGDGKNWASIIANANLNAKGLYIDITIKANRWYFFSFPFKVRKADISCGKNVKFVFRTYNGAIRAKYGKGGWIDLDSSEEYLYPGKGYIFQASLDCTLSIKIEKSAFGKLPNVNVDTKLDIHTSTNEQNASWNFVGNPFTAFYDINDMGYTSPITRWNSDSETYEAVRPGDDNAFLNPFEAFFVQCPKDNDDINFGGDNRLTQTGRDKKMNSQMQKARMEGQFDVQRQIVNLTLSDGTTTDKTRVVFNPDKKAGYERDCDAAKFESNGASELYTVEALAGRLAINERPEGSVKIGYRAAKAGEYTIAAQRMDRQVLLRDNDLQIIFDLTQGDYHFTSDAGEFDNRFMLLIDNSTTGIGDIVSTTGVNVKPTDSGLNISNLQGKTLHVYALNGALYATRTQDGFLGLAKGVYLVEVEGLKAKFMVR